MSRAIVVYAVFVVACARGGQGGSTDASAQVDAPGSTTKQDASMSMVDAAMAHDSSVPVNDAAVIIDAPPGSVFCSTNSQCTVSGECCVNLGGPQGFCAPGMVILGQCFPQ